MSLLMAKWGSRSSQKGTPPLKNLTFFQDFSEFLDFYEFFFKIKTQTSNLIVAKLQRIYDFVHFLINLCAKNKIFK